MTTIVSTALVTVAGALGIPIVVLLIEILAAFAKRPPRPTKLDKEARKRVAVVVPAHNESDGIVPTIEDIKPQLNDGDRLLVVADNCSDDTAKVAAAAGATVISRDDTKNIGKGYALGYAIDHLGLDPPDFVVFIDADCRLQAPAIRDLLAFCDFDNRPVQACYLMKSPENSPIDHSFAEFAFLLRNLIRPLGLSNLDGPVQLMGTGMAFPWDTIRAAPLANGHLVEDMKLGLDLAEVGCAPRFLVSVKVTSEFPTTTKGADSQRQRWVQGHLGMIWKGIPALLFNSIRRKNWNLLALTFDMLVPPLSLLGLLTVTVLVATAIFTACGGSIVGLLIAIANLILFAFALVVAWIGFGRDVLPGRKAFLLGAVGFKRFGLYARMIAGRTVVQWIRTDRGRD